MRRLVDALEITGLVFLLVGLVPVVLLDWPNSWFGWWLAAASAPFVASVVVRLTRRAEVDQ